MNDFDQIEGRVALFSSSFPFAGRIRQALADAFPHIEFRWSRLADRNPVEIASDAQPELGDAITKNDLLFTDAILIDPRQLKRSASSILESFATEKRTSAGAQPLLKACDSWGVLDRVLVNQSSLALLRQETDGSAAVIEEMVGACRIGIFRSGAESEAVNDLLAKIGQIVSLRRLGYHCDPRVRDLLMLVARRAVAKQPEPVIIWGESGTGKETAARHLYQLGQWWRGRQATAKHSRLELGVVHCGALSPELARGELFGHVRGAYTDAGAHTFGRLLRSIGCVRGEVQDVKSARPAVLATISELRELADRMQNLGSPTENFRSETVSKHLSELAENLGEWVGRHWSLLAKMASRANQGPTDPSEEYAALIESTNLFAADDRHPLSLRIVTNAPFGALFLDEFGELPPSVQVMLLRFLEYGDIEPLGYEGKISLVDEEKRHHLRIIVATSNPSVARAIGLEPKQDCKSKVESSKGVVRWKHNVIKPDLVFRLRQWLIALPSLQPSEVTHLIEIEKRETEFGAVIWDSGAIRELERMVEAAAIPGNRRQMRQIIRRCMAIANELPGLNRLAVETGLVTRDIVLEAASDIRLDVPPSGDSPGLEDRQHALEVALKHSDPVRELQTAINERVREETGADISQAGTFKAIRRQIPDKTKLCTLIFESALFQLVHHQYTVAEISQAWRAGPNSTGFSAHLERNSEGALTLLCKGLPKNVRKPTKLTAGVLVSFLRANFRPTTGFMTNPAPGDSGGAPGGTVKGARAADRPRKNTKGR